MLSTQKEIISNRRGKISKKTEHI